MSSVTNIPPSIKPLHRFSSPISWSQNQFSLKVPNLIELNWEKLGLIKRRAVASYSEEAASVAESDNSPVSIQLDPISTEDQFYRVIDEARRLQQSLVIVWVAQWCRKCIYLKPKLEKLAADYHSSIRFYSVDVNNVSHKLVAHAEVTTITNGGPSLMMNVASLQFVSAVYRRAYLDMKMPTIQLWSNGKKQGEVIGGHKPYLVVNEVREMIDNESSIL